MQAEIAQRHRFEHAVAQRTAQVPSFQEAPRAHQRGLISWGEALSVAEDCPLSLEGVTGMVTSPEVDRGKIGGVATETETETETGPGIWKRNGMTELTDENWTEALTAMIDPKIFHSGAETGHLAETALVVQGLTNPRRPST